MKLYSILVILVWLPEMAMVCAESQPGDAEKEVKRLEGTWKLISHKLPDSEQELADDDFWGKRELVIKGNEWTEKRIGKEAAPPKRLTVDPTKSPKTLDLVYKRGGKVFTQRPLYILEGDTLKVLYSSRGSHIRPADFQDPETNLYIWQRVKK